MSNTESRNRVINGFIVALALTSAACAADDQAPGVAATGAAATGGSASSGSTTGGSASGGLATGGPASPGGTGVGGSGSAALHPLPVVVDDFFAPSGYMEDARMSNATMTPKVEGDDTTCGGARAPSGRGFCHIVTFKFPTSGLGWGGVFWQYPSGNWGTAPGLGIAAGATKVRFMARGDVGGEIVGFGAGIGQGTETYADHIKIPNQNITLTNEWKEYTLELPAGADYSGGVVGPFTWGAGLEGNTSPMKFYLDDITFE